MIDLDFHILGRLDVIWGCGGPHFLNLTSCILPLCLLFARCCCNTICRYILATFASTHI